MTISSFLQQMYISSLCKVSFKVSGWSISLEKPFQALNKYLGCLILLEHTVSRIHVKIEERVARLKGSDCFFLVDISWKSSWLTCSVSFCWQQSESVIHTHTHTHTHTHSFSYSSPHTCQHLDFFYYIHPTVKKLDFTKVLICISLMIRDLEHHFMYTLAFIRL